MTQITKEFFISPAEDLKKDDAELRTMINLPKEQLASRWYSQSGQYILGRWRANAYDRKVLAEMVGSYYGHIDLRGVCLAKEKIQGADLSNIDFYSASFEGAQLENCNLCSSWLSQCNVKGTVFKWVKMSDVLLDDVLFDENTTFLGVNLSAINFTLAALLQDLATSQQRIQHLRRRNPSFAHFLRFTCNYGRSFLRFTLCCLITVLLFAVAYYLAPHALNRSGFWNSVLFSFVTFATSSVNGFDITSAFGRILFAAETGLGYLMLGILVAILVRRTTGL